MTSFGCFITILFGCLAVIDGADKAIGESCAAGDTCTDSTLQLKCDATTNTCLAKVGQSCAGANTDKCVTGAECDTANGNLCKCDDTHTEDSATKTCRVNLDQTCTDTDVCVANTVCDSMHKCLVEVGQSCAGTSTDKCVTGATCDTANGNLCKCDDTHTEDSATKTCHVNLGQACTSTDVCVANTVCDSTHKCLLEVDQSCAGANTDKCVTGATCGTGDLCKCDDTHTEDSATKTCRTASTTPSPGGGQDNGATGVVASLATVTLVVFVKSLF